MLQFQCGNSAVLTKGTSHEEGMHQRQPQVHDDPEQGEGKVMRRQRRIINMKPKITEGLSTNETSHFWPWHPMEPRRLSVWPAPFSERLKLAVLYLLMSSAPNSIHCFHWPSSNYSPPPRQILTTHNSYSRLTTHRFLGKKYRTPIPTSLTSSFVAIRFA